MKTCPMCGSTFADDELFCRNCGTKLSDSPPPPPPPDIKKKQSQAGMILLSLLLVAAVGAAFYLYTRMDYYQDRASHYSSQYDRESQARQEKEAALDKVNKELKEIRAEMETARAELESAQQKNSANQKQISERAETAEKNLSDLLSKLKNNYGFGSQNYYAEKGVVVLSKSGGSKSVGIICNLSTTTFSRTSDKGITCEWGSTVGNRCPVTIKAVSKGYHTIKFTNEANSDSFEILVIVTD